MDHFSYTEGQLFCEGIPMARLARSVGTPAYVYSRATFLDHYDRLAEAFAPLRPQICYAIKSCPNLHICRLLAERGAGFDVVSGGEVYRALRAGGDASRLVFAGVGKTDDEIRQAMDAGVGLFNVESEPELENLIRLAAGRRAHVRAALRINPDVDARTHVYTTTGLKETKFGVGVDKAVDIFMGFGRDPHVRLVGLHLHLGSPVNSTEPYVRAITRVLELVERLSLKGFHLECLDLGGGFGAHYEPGQAPSAGQYARVIVPLLKDRGLRIILEPGRSIACNAGILLTRVLYRKRSGGKNYVIVDAGMSELIRPALYQAAHFIWPVRPPAGLTPPSRSLELRLEPGEEVDVVGPICEAGDFLARSRYLPPVKRGDLLAVFSAGAYGFSMASQYNSRPRPPEILVEADSFRTIRDRETYEDLVRHEETCEER
jgi:diaminopimelate decarboxylase